MGGPLFVVIWRSGCYDKGPTLREVRFYFAHRPMAPLLKYFVTTALSENIIEGSINNKEEI